MNDQWAIIRYRNGGDRAANLVIATCFFDCGVADVARCCAAGWLAWLVSTLQPEGSTLDGVSKSHRLAKYESLNLFATLLVVPPPQAAEFTPATSLVYQEGK